MAIKHLQDGNAEHRAAYEWKTASVNVSGTDADTNITSITGFDSPALFATVGTAHRISITTSGTAYFRLNAATNDKITVTATTPYESDFVIAKKLFVSTGGSAITVTVKLN